MCKHYALLRSAFGLVTAGTLMVKLQLNIQQVVVQVRRQATDDTQQSGEAILLLPGTGSRQEPSFIRNLRMCNKCRLNVVPDRLPREGAAKCYRPKQTIVTMQISL